jgi:hypothetical protein
MLYIDVGNTLRGSLRTGIQRVVRSLAYELARKGRGATRLIAYDEFRHEDGGRGRRRLAFSATHHPH